MEYYSAIERNAFRSVLEPITQKSEREVTKSEVSQKEKDKYRILMHIDGIYKNGTEEFIYRATTEKQT